MQDRDNVTDAEEHLSTATETAPTSEEIEDLLLHQRFANTPNRTPLFWLRMDNSSPRVQDKLLGLMHCDKRLKKQRVWFRPQRSCHG